MHQRIRIRKKYLWIHNIGDKLPLRSLIWQCAVDVPQLWVEIFSSDPPTILFLFSFPDWWTSWWDSWTAPGTTWGRPPHTSSGTGISHSTTDKQLCLNMRHLRYMYAHWKLFYNEGKCLLVYLLVYVCLIFKFFIAKFAGGSVINWSSVSVIHDYGSADPDLKEIFMNPQR